jgi:hypothetical protein
MAMLDAQQELQGSALALQMDDLEQCAEALHHAQMELARVHDSQSTGVGRFLRLVLEHFSVTDGRQKCQGKRMVELRQQ